MGESVVEEVIGYRRPGSHRIRWSRVNASPIKNDAHEVVLAINFIMDITEQVRREETRRLLSTANELLGASLDLEENLRLWPNYSCPNSAAGVAFTSSGRTGFSRL